MAIERTAAKWRQFSVSHMLWLIALIAVLLAWGMDHYRQRERIRAIWRIWGEEQEAYNSRIGMAEQQIDVLKAQIRAGAKYDPQ